MLFRPDHTDLRLLGLCGARTVTVVGVLMLVPAAVAVALGETNEAYAFAIGAALAVIAGRAGEPGLATNAELRSSQGLAALALALIVAPLFAAVPLHLSGHFRSFLDAYFEAMSAFSTVGLSLANDVDHMPRSVVLWRHLMQFVGGQAIVIATLALFAHAAGAGSLRTVEARDERVGPDLRRAAGLVGRVGGLWAMVGSVALALALLVAGMPVVSALFHAVTLAPATFATGGFAPQSAGVAFYRSPLVEAVLMVLMVAGACSVALHYRFWTAHREARRLDLESRALALSILGLFTLLAVGLARTSVFTQPLDLLRHGFFQLVSAHTTTGLATVPGQIFVSDWGVLAPAMLVSAMALGGMAASPAGGIKALRVGLLAKGLRLDIRKVLLPENTEIIETYRAPMVRVLEPHQVRDAAAILLLFLTVYLGGGIVALFYGYGLDVALFESTAAASTGGLSVGLVRPSLEWPLKVVYLLQILLGRLEFVALFSLVGYGFAVLRGRV